LWDPIDCVRSIWQHKRHPDTMKIRKDICNQRGTTLNIGGTDGGIQTRWIGDRKTTDPHPFDGVNPSLKFYPIQVLPPMVRT